MWILLKERIGSCVSNGIRGKLLSIYENTEFLSKKRLRHSRICYQLLLLILIIPLMKIDLLLSASQTADVCWLCPMGRKAKSFELSVHAWRQKMKGESMKKAKSKVEDDLRTEYKRSDLGELVRGKYAARIAKSTNVVVLDPEVAKAFPNAEAVNQALLSLINVARASSRLTKRSSGRTSKTAVRR